MRQVFAGQTVMRTTIHKWWIAPENVYDFTHSHFRHQSVSQNFYLFVMFQNSRGWLPPFPPPFHGLVHYFRSSPVGSRWTGQALYDLRIRRARQLVPQ